MSNESILSLRKNEKKMKVINKKIIGESYIKGLEWRYLVLGKFKAIEFQQMSVKELIQFLKDNGVVFKQKDSLIKFPLMDLLNCIAKEANCKDFEIKEE